MLRKKRRPSRAPHQGRGIPRHERFKTYTTEAQNVAGTDRRRKAARQNPDSKAKMKKGKRRKEKITQETIASKGDLGTNQEE